ncbi:WxL domain-containing protein [Enterococcus casseliflavus]|uniref:WxL domain-containing protein n=1 Tax=Enterococcus casseliflavus TaxID=37734 RepID=UPI0012E0DD25|nr:WxL domain-containing protein [Enterococcus casseliflavus]MUN75744.1 hypothetical protein [Enterococcus casseliflavus]MUN98331.1 hypothetical protein [Enterococcus casseliflavus]
MKNKRIKEILVLGVTVIFLQAVCMPVWIAYAETTSSQEETPEQAELPTVSNLLETTEEKDPRFFFQKSHMEGIVNVPINVTISSDQEVSEFCIKLPEAAQVIMEQLPVGISMEKNQQTNEWMIQAQRAQNTFVLPIAFELAGNYELSVRDKRAVVDISNEEDITGEELSEDFSSNDSLITTERESSESSLENDQEKNKKDNSLEEKSTNEESPSTRSSVNVSNWEQYAAAINNQSVTVINVTANISGNSPLSNINRNLIINGNGFTINSQTQSYTLTGPDRELAVRNATIVSTRGFNTSVFGSTSSAIRPTFRFSNLTFNSTNRLVQLRSSHEQIITTILDGGNFDFSIPDTTTTNFNSVLAGSRRIIITNNAKVVVFNRRLSASLSSQTLAQTQDMTFQIDEGSSLITDFSVDGSELNISGSIEAARIRGHNSANPIVINLRGNGSLYLSNFGNSSDIISNARDITLNISKYSNFDFSQPSGNPLIRNSDINMYLDSENLALWDLALQEEEKASMVFSDIQTTLSGTNASVIDATTNERFQKLYDSSGLIVYSRMSNRPVEEMTRTVIAKYIDTDGNEIADSEVIMGLLGESYQTESKHISGYQLVESPSNESGEFSRETIEVFYVYETANVAPLDPLDPEAEVNPENRPELPEDQGQLSIDFISSFNFGSQVISVHEQTYYAQPQRLLNEDGTVNESEERPNYVQVSDRRSDNDRNGWNLAVTQNTQFATDTEHSLLGAQLQLMNQQVVTAQEGQEPTLQATNPLALVPGNKRTLLRAEGTEGTGTWIYRFGDGETAQESIALHVPKGTNPHAEMYQTTLTWELSAVPGN